VTALIEFDQVSYRPPNLASDQPDILVDISGQIQQGSFVAIIGKNGSGKTTLLQHINGLLVPHKGRVIVDGLDTKQLEHQRKLRVLAGMVFQNPADQIVSSTVKEDVAFGLENLNTPSKQIQNRVTEQLSSLGMLEDADRPPHLLSGGQIQKVALAGVLALLPKILLLDEPTSMLDGKSRESFLNTIRKLHRQGMTVIYITHHMEETIYADNIWVLDSGKLVLSGSPSTIFQQKNKLYELGLELPEAAVLARNFHQTGLGNMSSEILTSEDLLDRLPAYHHSVNLNHRKTQQVSSDSQTSNLIIMNNVIYTYLNKSPLQKQALRGVNLKIPPHTIHAVAGSNGSGKSTLLQHINGILRPQRGLINVAGYPLHDPETKLIDVIKKVGMVFQNPETQFFEINVNDEISFGPKQFSMDSIDDRIRDAMTMVGLDYLKMKNRLLSTLSGGEKRKVALASTLVLNQDIQLFDEPTAGMDPQSRDELLALFKQLNSTGKSIVIASHRLEELAAIASNLSIMSAGKVILSGAIDEIISDRATLEQANLTPPLTVQVTEKLINMGWPLITHQNATPEQLVINMARLIA
jgi:energy-coupling factor transport system ATP-binding protein